MLFFLGTYIGTVLLASTLFYFIPVFALAAFVIFSAFHFGEQHWSEYFYSAGIQTKAFFLNYGMTILSLLFYLNSSETLEIIAALTSVEFSGVIFLWGLVVFGGLFLIQLLLMYIRKEIAVQELLYELFLILVFLIVFNTATLIWAFAIYFIFWHSIPSIYEQLDYLYGEISFASFRRYLRSSAIVWLISIGGIFGLYFLIRDNEKLFLPLLFAFLGAITFAHSFIISEMFTSEKKS